MADSKIGVGATIGIVVGITAVLGLGLYLILKPKSSNVTANNIPTPNTDAEVKLLQAQLAVLKQQQANNPSLSQQQRDANDAQIQSIGIALGGKLVGSALDRWISGWGKNQTSVYGNTDLASGVPSGYMLDNPTGSVGQYDYLNPWSQTVLVKG